MGRMLEALRLPGSRNGHCKVDPPTPRVHRPEPEVVVEPEPEEEIPYIEVGGKNQPVEASSSVRASGPLPAARASLSPVLLHRVPVETPSAAPAPAIPILPAIPASVPVAERFAINLICVLVPT